MKARPILFSGPMVRALLDGRKCQTRRAIKPQPVIDGGWEGPPGWALFWKENEDGLSPEELARLCPYGQPGDLLWVRETFSTGWNLNPHTDKPIDEDSEGRPVPIHAFYRATEPENFRWLGDYGNLTENIPWKPSIHMPRWASRLTLELTEVRVERLQDISEADAIAEGCNAGWLGDALPDTPIGGGFTISSPGTYASAAGQYQILWNSINGPDSWDADPWVWVLGFRGHQQNVDTLLKSMQAEASRGAPHHAQRDAAGSK